MNPMTMNSLAHSFAQLDLCVLLISSVNGNGCRDLCSPCEILSVWIFISHFLLNPFYRWATKLNSNGNILHAQKIHSEHELSSSMIAKQLILPINSFCWFRFVSAFAWLRFLSVFVFFSLKNNSLWILIISFSLEFDSVIIEYLRSSQRMTKMSEVFDEHQQFWQKKNSTEKCEIMHITYATATRKKHSVNSLVELRCKPIKSVRCTRPKQIKKPKSVWNLYIFPWNWFSGHVEHDLWHN